MVVVPIAREIFRQAVRSFGRYYNLESKAFNKLYTGFPRSRLVGRGVRHGLTAGSVAGTFINKAPDTPGNDAQIPFTKRQSVTPRKPYQTRQRRTTSACARCANESKFDKGNRYSYARRY